VANHQLRYVGGKDRDATDLSSLDAQAPHFLFRCGCRGP
jgi:hypothetical protein